MRPRVRALTNGRPSRAPVRPLRIGWSAFPVRAAEAAAARSRRPDPPVPPPVSTRRVPASPRPSLAGAWYRRGSAPSPAPDGGATRSEEHTSELQSRLHLVCRLLLEKKKNKYCSLAYVEQVYII